MSGVLTIEEGLSELQARPRPALCLDTCDFFDIVRAFAIPGNDNDQMARRMLNALGADPSRFQLVITDLVRREWAQNLGEVEAQAIDDLQGIITKARRVEESLVHSGIRPQLVEPDPSVLPLVPRLVGMAVELIGRSMILRQDEACVGRALARVLEKRRPSLGGAIKDSLNLEHYLELARSLGRSHFQQPCIFVSGNKKDYWEGSRWPHPDLRGDLDAAGLRFFGKLDAALGMLRL